MLFNSFDFIIALIITLFLFWIVKDAKLKLTVLLASSLISYGYYFPPYVLLLFVLAGVGYLTSRFMVQYNHKKKFFLVMGIVFQLGFLFVFKYTDFVIKNINLIFASEIRELGWLLPLGISFIVFQIIAYQADIYRGVASVEMSFPRLLAFISFFPHLIAGPICRAHQLINQLAKFQKFNKRFLTHGAGIFFVGLALKVGLADNFAPLADETFGSNPASPHRILWGVMFYGLQIFCDFWGYSTMAIGAALMFGITLPFNFNFPYIASSLKEFWQRWHITLSTWLRDYLYISMGGNRKGQILTYRNLVVTMFLGGLWHGANWNFVIWGLIHGFGLVVEKFISEKTDIVSHLKVKIFRQIFGWLWTMITVFTAWIFFRSQTFKQAVSILNGVIENFRFSWSALTTFEQTCFIFFLLFAYPANQLIKKMRDEKVSDWIPLSIVIWVTSFLVIFSAKETKKFIYFDF